MRVYNKLFTKILDSSIWLEPDATRLVWLTLLAAMDEDGFAQFASIKNLAHRARVAVGACSKAIACLESDDRDSSDPEHGGRRIERVPGGWMILNAAKYRDLVTRVVSRERTKERVRRFRERRRNAAVTPDNDRVTPSEAYSEADTRSEAKTTTSIARGAPLIARRKTWAAFEGSRGLAVPQGVHQQFRDLVNQPDADDVLFAWYAAVCDEWTVGARKGENPGTDMPAFWKARFEERWPPTPKVDSKLPAWARS